MEIPISYYPILHLPSVKPNGLTILNPTHKTRKWAVVGSDGQLRSYRIKNKEIKVRFTYSTSSNSPEICSVFGDSIIVSSKNELLSINKKGKSQKFKKLPFEEPISCLAISGSKVIASSGSLISELKNESGNPTTSLPSPAVSIIFRETICYVGSSDGTIATFIGGGIQNVAKLPAALTCLAPLQRTATQSYIIAGCADCKLRIYNAQDKFVSEITLGSPATSIGFYDFDKDGFAEILVGLEDSTINLINIALIDTPKVLSSLQLGFNVSNIGIGSIYFEDMISALVTSQTGQTGIVFIEPRSNRSVFDSKAPKITEKEIDELKKRISELELHAKQSKVKHSTSIPAQTSVDIRGDPVTQKFVFLVESERPISRLALSSTIPIKYYPRADCQTVISLCPQKTNNYASIIKPIDKAATRVAFDFSYEIGHGGELISYVSFVKNPAVLNKNFNLKPFGLLKKVETDVSIKKLNEDSLAILEVINPNNASTLRSLLDKCLPTMLDDDEPQTFSSGAIGSTVTVVVKGDKFTAKSIYVPIIVQLRTFILDSMNKAKQNVKFETKLGEKCIFSFFKAIEERLFTVMQIGFKYYKLQALQDVRNSSPNSNFGDEDTTRIIQDAPIIEKQFMECKDEYEAFIEEVKMFYIEIWKRNNIDASPRVNDLLSALKEVKDEESLNTLIEFMRSKPK